MKHLNLLCLLFISGILISCHAQNKPNPKQVKGLTNMNLTSTDTTGLLMNEDDFWKIIDKSQAISENNYQKQIRSLKRLLLALDSIEIIKFDNTFTALLAGSYTAKLWGASYVINGGCSDDCFEYFRGYLIAHGKEKFYATLNDPESCVTWIKSEEEDNWEGIRYSASNAYKQKTGNDIPETYQPEFVLKGKLFDEDTVYKQYPKLAKKFMGK